jgi:hypothetical protein
MKLDMGHASRSATFTLSPGLRHFEIDAPDYGYKLTQCIIHGPGVVLNDINPRSDVDCNPTARMPRYALVVPADGLVLELSAYAELVDAYGVVIGVRNPTGESVEVNVCLTWVKKEGRR